MNPIADLRRRLDNMIRPGTIYAVDHVNARCRVETGGLLTGWLRYFVGRAGAVRRHSAPTPGEQCTVLSPSGEMAAGFVLVGLNSNEFSAPSDNLDLDSTTYADGTWFGYDMGNQEMTVIMTPGGRAILQAPGGVQIAGDVNITGTVTVSDDVIAGGISLVNHAHSGVESGGSNTGGPQ
ncbi:baseplate assembly protein [Halopseudomonas bauzanensis]|nr:baseplate assembly protein [Halopseudomonas bauzanensis]